MCYNVLIKFPARVSNALNIYIPENVRFVLSRLESFGFEAFIVGGCVRDSLFELTPADYDVTTNALPNEVKGVFSDTYTIDTGIKHGTVTVMKNGTPIEITTYRIDGKYSDNRRPDSVTFSKNLEEDLSRRDFTINAMAYSEKTGIIDKFGGQDDLKNRLIRCVGNPSDRFSEDSLRILRALRFASKYNFGIDAATSLSIHEKASLIRNVSVERIACEFEKLLCGKSPAHILADYTDVFAEFIPEIKKCGEKSATDYSAIENSLCDVSVRLAVFFCNTEKPFTDSCDECKGQLSEKIMKRLKLPNKTISEVKTLVKYHDIIPNSDRVYVKKLLSQIGENNFKKLICVMEASQNICDEAELMNKTMLDVISSGEAYTREMLEINGKDVIEAGFEGKKISETLNKILTLVIEDKLKNERAVLLKAIYELKGA